MQIFPVLTKPRQTLQGFVIIRKTVLDRLLSVIRNKFPDKVKDFEYAIENYDNWASVIRKEAKELEKKYGLKVKEVVVHGDKD